MSNIPGTFIRAASAPDGNAVLPTGTFEPSATLIVEEAVLGNGFMASMLGKATPVQADIVGGLDYPFQIQLGGVYQHISVRELITISVDISN